NGQLKRQNNYIDNVKHGRETWYNADGTIQKVLIFESGELISTEEN
ncbi:MAG: hypothetical protein H8D45_22215, partial [Bacteroidetes bacterium]|nr:hypothetical protein [Bacteroidota bacterium]